MRPRSPRMFGEALDEDSSDYVLKIYMANPYVVVVINNAEEFSIVVLSVDMLSRYVSRRPELPDTLPQGRMALCRKVLDDGQYFILRRR